MSKKGFLSKPRSQSLHIMQNPWFFSCSLLLCYVLHSCPPCMRSGFVVTLVNCLWSALWSRKKIRLQWLCYIRHGLFCCIQEAKRRLWLLLLFHLGKGNRSLHFPIEVASDALASSYESHIVESITFSKTKNQRIHPTERPREALEPRHSICIYNLTKTNPLYITAQRTSFKLVTFWYPLSLHPSKCSK